MAHPCTRSDRRRKIRSLLTQPWLGRGSAGECSCSTIVSLSTLSRPKVPPPYREGLGGQHPSARHDWRTALIEGSSHVLVFVSCGFLTDNVAIVLVLHAMFRGRPRLAGLAARSKNPEDQRQMARAPPQPAHFDGTHTKASNSVNLPPGRPWPFSRLAPSLGEGGVAVAHQPWYTYVRAGCHNHPPLSYHPHQH